MFVLAARRSSTPTSTPSSPRSSSGTTRGFAVDPVIVGGGVVLAASYEAKAYGVRRPWAAAQARRLCPHAIVVPPRMAAYSEASKAVFALFEDTTPLVEGLSIDEAFLDVRGLERLAGSPAEIAARLRRRVLDEVGLPITVGIARTKFLAKVASGVAKPNGLLVVPPDDELGFLHPLPVERLWGVGRVTAAKLHAARHPTVGQVARLDEPLLVHLLGRASGRHLHALAHNRDPRPRAGRPPAALDRRAARAGPRAESPEEIDATLVAIVDRVARRLRAGRRVCRTVVLRLRFDDFSRATRSFTLPTRDRPHLHDPRRGTRPARGGGPADPRRTASPWWALAHESRGRRPCAARAAPTTGGRRARRRARRGAQALRRDRGHARLLVGRGPGIAMPLLPD